jgi:ATP-dependent helicase/nuclease subunit A
LYKLAELVRLAEGLHVADFASAVKWLQEAMAREIEPLSLLLGESDVVRVMNLHKAKGLEASVVILAAPWEYGDHDPSLHVDRMGGGESSGYFLVSKKTGDYTSKVISHPPDWDGKSAEERRYTDAERSRLLYVAATRARQLLVVTDALDIKKGTNPWGPLKQHVENDLSMKGIDLAVKARPQKTVDGKKGEKQIQAVRQALEAGVAVSVRKEVVTKVAKAWVLFPSVGTQGKGPVWGEIIHRCLQAVARGVTLTKPLVESIMAERDWPLEEADEAIAVIERVRKSDLWKRVEESKERHTEVPFAMAVDGNEIGQAEGDCLLEGVIDLVFREDGNWVIVDYKTDRVVGNLEPYLNYYSPQVKLYAKAWEKLSKEAVGAAYLYFVSPGELRPVELS